MCMMSLRLLSSCDSQVQLMVDGEYQMMLGCVPISRPLLPTNGQPEA